jgi:ferredoxin-NADP reductase/uncharacterized protein YcbX
MMTEANLAGTILRIMRYPIKGFRGEELNETHLSKGQGLPHDRRWAIRNGSLPKDLANGWEPCQTFIRMTQHEELPLYPIEKSENALYLSHPNGEKIAIQQNNSHKKILSSWFTHKNMSLSYSNSETAYWDHQDAHISIINMMTVKAISSTTDIELDPQRFRGNILIETPEPWSELNLIGRRITIGTAELEILRPIDRCKATSVDPATGSSDINIPHLLSSQYGHIFCGVYARVISPGSIRKNDCLYNTGNAPKAITDGVKPATAPAAEQWPRPMRLVKRIKESDDVDSFWLEDPLSTVIKHIPPASYLRFHTESPNGPLTRSYTISQHSEDGRFLRLSIKKETGKAQFSPWIHSRLREGDTILASGPFVDPSLAWRPHLSPQKDVLILTAGIGITIATSIISSLKQANYTSRVSVAHSVQYEKDAALWDEIILDINSVDNATACLFITQEKEKADTQDKKYGRVDIPYIVKDIALNNVQVFLCGPQKFNHAMNLALTEKGIDSSSIHEDIFSSPAAPSKLTNKKASLTTPTPITFIHASGEKTIITWQPQDGTLLDTAEKNNISITANCRSGACRACLYAIEGEVENLSTPVSPAPKNWAYLCCAAPLSPLTIKERSHLS